jgi:hypothetical protein
LIFGSQALLYNCWSSLIHCMNFFSLKNKILIVKPVNKIPWMFMSDLSTPNSISWSPLSQSESCFLMKKSSYSEWVMINNYTKEPESQRSTIIQSLIIRSGQVGHKHPWNFVNWPSIKRHWIDFTLIIDLHINHCTCFFCTYISYY